MQIIDNFITKTYFQEIQNLMTGSNFPWYYNNNISISHEVKKENKTNFGFSHNFIKDGKDTSQMSHFLRAAIFKMMDAASCNNILRCRGDMTVNSQSMTIHDPHQDYEEPNVATILYINESDGDTIIYKDHQSLEVINRISPVPNRLVLFNGDNLHTGCSPFKNKNRILINSNFNNIT